MKEKLNYLEIILIAGGFVAVIIGSGFATGQEIMQFFTAYGLVSLLGGLLCALLYALSAYAILDYSKQNPYKSTNEILAFFNGALIARFYKIYLPIFLFSVYVVMVAGGGAIAKEYFALPKELGSFIITILSILVLLLGFDKMSRFVGALGPLIVILATLTALFSLMQNYENLASSNLLVASLDMKKAARNWLFSAILYVGFNLTVAAPFLIGLGKSASNRKNALIGGVLGAVVFAAVAMLLSLAMLACIQEVYLLDVPTLYLARKLTPLAALLLSLVLLAGIFTTAVPLLWSVCESFFEEGSKKYKIFLIILGILGYFLGLLPFSYLINYIYPSSGVVGLLLLAGALLKGFRKSS